MLESRERSAVLFFALVGLLVGIAVLWLSRPDRPACTTLDNGMRACMPVLVEGPPVWLYGAFGIAGALMAGGFAFALASARRARSG